MYDVAEYISSPKGFDKYELAKVFQHVTLHPSKIHQLDPITVQTLENFFCYFVNPKLELYDREKCTFGYEVVGEDDQNRLFVSGEYSTILQGQEKTLPGHNYFFSFALKRSNTTGDWEMDVGHLLEMSFLRSLYFERSGGNKYRVNVESEHGRRVVDGIADVSKHNWLQEFNALSSA